MKSFVLAAVALFGTAGLVAAGDCYAPVKAVVATQVYAAPIVVEAPLFVVPGVPTVAVQQYYAAPVVQQVQVVPVVRQVVQKQVVQQVVQKNIVQKQVVQKNVVQRNVVRSFSRTVIR